ncbi:restriction system-associated AAA family ATPase [Pseudoalteromonas distincta]|uniref:restriction system-associated AAA family ATPase n=1 Tax=Pseudoalteromonas distincta TaxID=77608 RepID=UPI0032188A8F
MKLLYLNINSQYGSIKKGFKLQFRDAYEDQRPNQLDWTEFNPFCLAGLNGSGKSNVLEILANIFYHIECCANVNQPKNFQESFNPKVCKPDAFELVYYISQDKTSLLENMTKISVTKLEGEKPEMTYQLFPFDKKPVDVTVVAEKYAKIPAPAKLYLPDLVIGYSSGENEILSIPFLKTRLLNFDEYRLSLEEKARYKEPESSLLYVDYELSQAVLLANLLFQEKDVLEPLHNELGIKDIIRFRMNINLHKHKEIPIVEQYQDMINAFSRCATSCYEDNDKLILDFWVNSASKIAFKKNFPEGVFQLFQALQVLYTLNYRTVKSDIKSDVYRSTGYFTDGKVPTSEPEEKVFFFLDFFIKKIQSETNETIPLLLKNLSDGEQQFLHTLGICLMLKDKSALLLLDEPETHFNPDWRSKFISILKTSLGNSKSNHLMRDILITSHSPFIISDCYPDKVIVCEKNKQPLNARNMSFRTYGTSIDIIMENIFKKRNTIGDLSRKEIEDIQTEIESVEILTKSQVEMYKIRTNHLGDSMEKILLFARLNELEIKE